MLNDPSRMEFQSRSNDLINQVTHATMDSFLIIIILLFGNPGFSISAAPKVIIFHGIGINPMVSV